MLFQQLELFFHFLFLIVKRQKVWMASYILFKDEPKTWPDMEEH